VDTRLYQHAVRLPPAIVVARSVTYRMAVASGVPSSEESERSRQLGQQDVLDTIRERR
jgi:hypothetical protein